MMEDGSDWNAEVGMRNAEVIGMRKSECGMRKWLECGKDSKGQRA